jgi:hypothetical protein
MASSAPPASPVAQEEEHGRRKALDGRDGGLVAAKITTWLAGPAQAVEWARLGARRHRQAGTGGIHATCYTEARHRLGGHAGPDTGRRGSAPEVQEALALVEQLAELDNGGESQE